MDQGNPNQNGIWVEDVESIRSLFLHHFEEAYDYSHPMLEVESWEGWDFFKRRISNDHLTWLERPFTGQEVKKRR